MARRAGPVVNGGGHAIIGDDSRADSRSRKGLGRPIRLSRELPEIGGRERGPRFQWME